MSGMRARMLHASISNSERVARLSCDGARLLFTWLIPHCDNLGRLRAEPIQLKASVMPRHVSTLPQLKRWTDEMHRLGLVQVYTSQGQRFLVVNNWSQYQRLHVNHSTSSNLPPPPDNVRSASVVPTENVALEVEGEGEGEGEDKHIPSSAAPMVSVGLASLNGNAKTSKDDPAPREWFLSEFWPKYPRRVGRSAALGAFLSVVRGLPESKHDSFADLLLSGLERDLVTEWADRAPDKIPHAATWINQRRWEDDR